MESVYKASNYPFEGLCRKTCELPVLYSRQRFSAANKYLCIIYYPAVIVETFKSSKERLAVRGRASFAYFEIIIVTKYEQ